MRTLLALGLLAFPQEAPRAADRAEITDSVESWYKIVKDDDQRGWIGEHLKRVNAAHRYTYSLRSQYFVSEDGIDRRRTVMIDAKLDDAFAPKELRAFATQEDTSWEYTLTPAGDGFRLDTIQADGTLRQWKLTWGADFHALPALMFYALRQNDQLSKPGPRIVALLHPLGEPEPRSEVTFTVKEMAPRDIPVKKGASLTPVVFGKAPPCADKEYVLKEAWIDKFGRIAEATTRGGHRIVLAETERDATEGMIKFLHESLHDPFDKSRALKGKQGRRAAPPEPLVTDDTLPSDLNGAFKDLDELRLCREEGRTDEARELYDKVLRSWKRMTETAAALGRKDILHRLPSLREDLEKAWPGAEGVLNLARPVYIAALEAADRDDLRTLETRLLEIDRLAARLEVKGRPEGEAIARWARQLRPILISLKDRIVLASKKLVVSGITLAWSESEETAGASATILGHQVGEPARVRFTRPLSVAVINGASYRVGETIEGEGVTVDRIAANGVRIRYRGEVRDLPLGR